MTKCMLIISTITQSTLLLPSKNPVFLLDDKLYLPIAHISDFQTKILQIKIPTL